MGTQFDVRPDPLAPFTMIDQTSIMRPAERMLLVTSPNGGNVLTPGVRTLVTWESTGSTGFVDIDYSTDNGATYTTIAQGVTDLGSYAWRVPNVYAGHSFVRVTQTDLIDTFASDRSDCDFVINGAKPTAASPVTGLQEEITLVKPGDIITAPSFSTVYAVDGDGTRRPFALPGVIDTYTFEHNPRVVVTDATLQTIPLGMPMLPKPGTALIKFPVARTVYAVEGNASYAILRPLHSEDIAAGIYGENWKEYVWTLPEDYKKYYHGGSEIVTVIVTDMTELRKTAE